MKNMILLILLIVQSCPIIADANDPDTLPIVILSGNDGGYIDGQIWNSDVLKNKINLVLYVDPAKQNLLKPLLARLDSISYSSNLLGTTFILNTAATVIPDFVIRNKVRERAKFSKNTTYVLDRNKVLVKKWRLIDNDINVLLLDKDGKILQKRYGEMNKIVIDQLIDQINSAQKDKETL
jgi:predicted transcriptional regulator